ncbi:MAG: YcxB family protein [Alteromonadaceae bacterium]|nr:YcxB family protein [Alteromonadaceae bacterium]
MFKIIVRYRLSEYLCTLKEVSSFELGKEFVEKWYFKAITYFIWTAAFLYKSVREGVCYFSFYDSGFERRSNSGSSKLAWESLRKVIILDNCYLLVSEEEAIWPLPKRCFSKVQMMQLETWTRDMRGKPPIF